MRSWLAPIQSPAFAAMRFVFGVLFMCHGLQKLFGLFGGHMFPLGSQLGMAGVIEAFGGALIALGLFTPIVAFIACGEMAVAFFTQHFPRGAVPIQNGGELAVLYCWAFLFIAAHGAGPFSLDALVFGRPRRQARSSAARA